MELVTFINAGTTPIRVGSGKRAVIVLPGAKGGIRSRRRGRKLVPCDPVALRHGHTPQRMTAPRSIG